MPRKTLCVITTALSILMIVGCKKESGSSSSAGSSSSSASAASDIKWWAITEISPGGNLICTLYAFGPGDFVYKGAPRADAHTADDLRRLDPANVGTVTTDGNTKTYQFPGKPAETPRGGVLQPVVPVNGTFNGTYSVSNSSTFGGVQAVGGNIWTFHSNGTFEHETFGGVATTPHITGTGSAPGNATGKTDTITKGRYTFGQGTLTLTGDAGATETHAAWNIGDHTPPWYINIDGLTFKASL